MFSPSLRIGQLGKDPTIDLAVSELTRYLKQMDPNLTIDLLLSDEADPSLEPILWVGLSPSFEIPTHQWDDTIAINMKEGRGYISGSNPRSVLIAVYRVLKELGCRFLHPGKTGERIPSISISTENLTLSIRETASCRHRGICIEGADTFENIADTIDFLPKVGMNEYFIQFMVPTEFFDRWYNHRNNPLFQGGRDGVLGESEPSPLSRSVAASMTKKLEQEISRRSLIYHKVGHGWTCEPFGIEGSGWFQQSKPLSEEQRSVLAEVKGVREPWGGVPLNTNLCYSRADVREKITDAITSYAKTNPQVDVIHFWLADGSNNHCECENCRRKRPADWYVQMLNELDRKMSAENLPTKIVFLIYVDLLWEPVETKIENPNRFILMFAPITRVYGKNYSDFLTYDGELPPYERNHLKMPDSLSQNLEHLRRWQKEFAGDSFDFDYHLMWAHVGDPGYEACAKNLFQDMKDLHLIGLDGMVSCQVQRSYLPTALPVLSMAAALWDEKASYEALANDYYLAAFGSDGPKIRQMLIRLSSLFHFYEGPARSAAASLSGCDDPAEARRLLEQLKALLKKDLCSSNAASDDAVTDSVIPFPADQSAYDRHALLVYADFLTGLCGVLEKAALGDPDEAKAAAEKLILSLWEKEPAIQPLLDVQNTVRVLSGFFQA